MLSLALCLTVLEFFSGWLALGLLLLAVVTWLNLRIGVALFLVLVALDLERAVFHGIVVSFSELELAVVLAIGGGVLLTPPSRYRELDFRVLRWGSPLALAVLISSLVNNEWYRALPHTLRMLELVFAMFLADNCFRSQKSARVFRYGLGGATLLYSLNGLYEFPTAYKTRIFSFFGSPNQFAGFLILMIPFLLVAFSPSSRKRVAGSGVALPLVAATALLMTQSRAAIVGVLVGVCTMVALSRKSPIWRALLRFPTLIALLLIIVVVTGVVATDSDLRSRAAESLAVFDSRLETGPLTAFRELRVPFLLLGWEIWKDNPVLGIGPGNYEDQVRGEYSYVVARYESRLSDFLLFRDAAHIHVHNLYLHTAVVFGLVGLGALMYFLFRLGWTFFQARQASLWAVAGLGSVMAFLVHNLLDVTFPSLGIELGLVWGGALALSKASPVRVQGEAGGGSGVLKARSR
jgi:O-antigen ligase